eukprot:6455056-Amphidinium_carterae.4
MSEHVTSHISFMKSKCFFVIFEARAKTVERHHVEHHVVLPNNHMDHTVLIPMNMPSGPSH